jgi:hypothetical protein
VVNLSFLHRIGYLDDGKNSELAYVVLLVELVALSTLSLSLFENVGPKKMVLMIFDENTKEELAGTLRNIPKIKSKEMNCEDMKGQSDSTENKEYNYFVNWVNLMENKKNEEQILYYELEKMSSDYFERQRPKSYKNSSTYQQLLSRK